MSTTEKSTRAASLERTRRKPYAVAEAGFGLPGGGVGGRVRFEDPRLRNDGFASVEVAWRQAGSRFVLQELVIRGEDLSLYRCRQLPLERLLHDAATEIPRSASAVWLGRRWRKGAPAAAMLRSASLAARRGRRGSGAEVLDRNEAILRRHEAGETYAQLADSENRDASLIGKWLRAARDERQRRADQQREATGGHRQRTPS